MCVCVRAHVFLSLCIYVYITICIYRYVYMNTCVCMYVDYAWTYVPKYKCSCKNMGKFVSMLVDI